MNCRICFARYTIILVALFSSQSYAENTCPHPIMVLAEGSASRSTERTFAALDEINAYMTVSNMKTHRGFTTGANGKVIYDLRSLELRGVLSCERSNPENCGTFTRDQFKELLQKKFPFLTVDTCYNPENPSVIGSN